MIKFEPTIKLNHNIGLSSMLQQTLVVIPPLPDSAHSQPPLMIMKMSSTDDEKDGKILFLIKGGKYKIPPKNEKEQEKL